MRILLLAIVLAGLVGCSKTDLVYRNADWLIERWADALLDLTSEQKDAWRNDLDGILARHRDVELPQLTGFLRDFEQVAGKELPEPVVECLVERADVLFRRHALLAVDLAVPLLTALTDEQIAGLTAELEKRNAQYREEFLVGHAVQRLAGRTQRILERIERWTGPLESDQREIVATASREMPDLAGPWLEYRRERQRQLLLLVRNRTEPNHLRRFLEAWWVELADRPSSLVDAGDAVRRDSITLLSRLDRTLSQGQRGEMVARVSRLRTDLEALTWRAPAPVSEPDGPSPASCDTRTGAPSRT